MMTDANATYRTVLLIKAKASGAEMNGLPAAERRHRLDAALARVQTALRESGVCRESRIAGEELVGLFASADAALDVACQVQQACAEHTHDSTLAHLGMLLDRQPEHLRGDSPQACGAWGDERAEQLLQQVLPGQIFATKAITGRLSEVSRARFRLYEWDDADVPGDCELYQVVCHEETITRIALPTLNQDRVTSNRSLCLRWRDNTMTLAPESPSLTMGRSEQTDIRIDSELASRIHARLCFQETNFILADQSTNGTFVQIDDDEEVHLHHEQIVLRGSGVISLGRRIRGGRGKLIYFTLTG